MKINQSNTNHTQEATMAIFVGDMLTEIANHVDLQTVPYLQASCKLAYGYVDSKKFRERVIEDTKNKLEQMVNLVREFHNTIHKDPEVKAKLITQLQNGFTQYAEENPYPAAFLFAEMINFAEYAQCDIVEASRVWIESSFGRTISEEDAPIYKALQNYVVGSCYSFAFQYMDRNEVGTYYSHGSISFNENGEYAMEYCIQDVKNGKDILDGHKEAISKIPGAYLDGDGLIQFKITETSIYELAKFVVDMFGMDNALYETDMVSYIKPSSKLSFPKRHDVFEAGLNMDLDQWRDRLITILDGTDC
jgi:hypothetical protein